MASKSPQAFRTIREVADWLGVEAHVLRFWESKFSQVKPVKRAGGRRYYRPADMQLVGGIKVLLHDQGLTIRGVQKMIREDGVSSVTVLSPDLDEKVADQQRELPKGKGPALSMLAAKSGRPSLENGAALPDTSTKDAIEDAEIVETATGEAEETVQEAAAQDATPQTAADDIVADAAASPDTQTQQEGAPRLEDATPVSEDLAEPAEEREDDRISAAESVETTQETDEEQETALPAPLSAFGEFQKLVAEKKSFTDEERNALLPLVKRLDALATRLASGSARPGR